MGLTQKESLLYHQSIVESRRDFYWHSNIMQEHQRSAFLATRDRHPPNQAITFIENNVALPGQPLPVFSERAHSFVSLDEARLHQKER